MVQNISTRPFWSDGNESANRVKSSTQYCIILAEDQILKHLILRTRICSFVLNAIYDTFLKSGYQQVNRNNWLGRADHRICFLTKRRQHISLNKTHYLSCCCACLLIWCDPCTTGIPWSFFKRQTIYFLTKKMHSISFCCVCLPMRHHARQLLMDDCRDFHIVCFFWSVYLYEIKSVEYITFWAHTSWWDPVYHRYTHTHTGSYRYVCMEADIWSAYWCLLWKKYSMCLLWEHVVESSFEGNIVCVFLKET